MNKRFKQLLTLVMLPAFALMVVGCGPTKEDPKASSNAADKNGGASEEKGKKKMSSGHFHGNNPNSHVYQVGSTKYWYEVFYDSARETANIHIVKSDKKTPLLIPAETVTYTFNGDKSWELKAVDAKDGNAYKFALEDKALVNALTIGGGELILKVGDEEFKSSKPADPNH